MALLSNSTKIPSPPPPNTVPQPESTLRDPFSPEFIPPNRHFIEERSHKRRQTEETRNKSLLQDLELQQQVDKILCTTDMLSIEELINEFIKNPSSCKTIFDSLVNDYPNSFVFKLLKLLEYYPSFPIRNKIVSILLRIFKESEKINFNTLNQVKKPLLSCLNHESRESLLPDLCKIIGLVAASLYQQSLGGWEELLVNVFVSFYGTVKLSHMKALLLLAELPEEVLEHRQFWIDRGYFDVMFINILKFVNSSDKELQDLTFNASLTVMKMSKVLERIKVCDSLLPLLLCFIDLHSGEEEGLLEMVHRLFDLVTLDIEEMFKGKEGDVFWCMIRVAEMKDASDPLMCTVVHVIQEFDEAYSDAMESVIKKLSKEEVQRVFSVAMDLMSCVVDDPVWYDIDNKNCIDAGLTEKFRRGKFLLNFLSFDGNEGVFVPTAIEMIENIYAPHEDWRVRHAAMLTIAAIVGKHFKGDMILYIDRSVSLVQKSLNDRQHQVLWATMHAIKYLSEYKEILKFLQYHIKFLLKLVPIIQTNLCSRVQANAVSAIRILLTNCGLEKILTLGGEIAELLLELLKHEKQKLREEALEALNSIIILMPVTFYLNYYDTTMAELTLILYEIRSSSSLFVRVKCLECMGNLVRKFGQDKLQQNEVVQLVETLISLDGKLGDTDHFARYVILKALDQFCQSEKVNIDEFLDKIMPMLLKYAQLDLDLTHNMPKDESLEMDDNKHFIENVRVRACNMLSRCALRSAKKISPYIVMVTNIIVGYVDCSSLETRKASISALPHLLHVIKDVKHKQNHIDLTHSLMISLIQVLRKETNNDLCKRIWWLLAKCIKNSGKILKNEIISNIVDEISQTLKKIMENETERAQKAEISEGGSDLVSTEETIKDVGFLISTIIQTYRMGSLLYIDGLMKNVAVFFETNMPDRVFALAISIFNILVPQFPEKLPQYHHKYIIAAIEALKEESNYPQSQLHATRAIGICAKFGRHDFGIGIVSVSISRLNDVLKKRIFISEPSGDLARLCDTAVSVLGKICEFHRDSIKPKVVQNWLNLLPLKHNVDEATSAHGVLSRLIKRSDQHLFGIQNENLPKIISVVKEILSRPDRLAKQNHIDDLISFINQYGGM